MKQIRAWLLFTPLLYRVALYLALPAAAIVLQALPAACTGNAALPGAMCALMFSVYEMILDQRILGGTLAAESAATLEYLKSSDRGRSLYRNMLHGDQLQRLLLHGIVLSLLYVAGSRLAGGGPSLPDAMLQWALIVPASWGAAQTGILAGRRMENQTARLLIAYGICILYFLSLRDVLYLRRTALDTALCALWCLSGAFSGWRCIRDGIKKKEAEYYDA